MGANRRMSRRGLLRRVGGCAAAAVAAPWIVPASALGRGGAVPPSERILLGGIGINNRGTSVLRWLMHEKDVHFVAICDVRKDRRQAVKQMADQHNGSSDCATYVDLREFLAERTDIDAVLIATGERWHALASILAMRAGKDVYSEKPGSMTIAEGRAVVETARRYGRVYQSGTQRLSEANFVFAIEMARTGRLGTLQTARAHIAPWDDAYMKRTWERAEPEPPKDVVWWDGWLGPCPWRPYNARHVRGGWRGHYDFHTGCIGEWGAHTFAQAQAGIDAPVTTSVEYEFVDNPYGDGMVTRLANGVKLTLHRGTYWHGSCGMRFEGTQGWAAAADGYSHPDVSNPAMLADFKKIVGDYIARTGRAMNHARSFLDCVKSRRLSVSNPEVMHRAMSTVHAANICMWLRRNLKYDPVKEEFVGDDEANRFRSRGMRQPWTI